MNTERLVLLGPPACGKGTQGQIMSSKWGVPLTSVGEVLRGEAAAGTALGREAATFTDAGSLVPDRLALASMAGWLNAHPESFVFDGFPRTVGQAESFEKILAGRGTPLTGVLWLEVPLATVQERVSRRLICSRCKHTFSLGWQVAQRGAPCPDCGGALQVRQDDDPAALRRRLEQYREHTEPLLDFYARRQLLHRIDAQQSPEKVFAEIEAALERRTANVEALAA